MDNKLRNMGTGLMRGGMIGGVLLMELVFVGLLDQEIRLRQYTQSSLDFRTIDFPFIFSIALFYALPVGAAVGAIAGGFIAAVANTRNPQNPLEEDAKPSINSILKLC
jgi:hypothetical protein